MEFKEIQVNKECYINQENIIKSKDNLEVAVSVLAKDNVNTKGFLHFCLAMDTYCQCCENFDLGLIRNTPNNIEYVSKIKIYDSYEDLKNDNININILNKFNEETRYILTEDRYYSMDYIGYYLVVVFGKDNETLLLAYVYNEHNGYYAHEVVIAENDDIEVTYL